MEPQVSLPNSVPTTTVRIADRYSFRTERTRQAVVTGTHLSRGDTVKATYSENNLCQCHCFDHKSTWSGLGLNPLLRGERLLTDSLSRVDGRHEHSLQYI